MLRESFGKKLRLISFEKANDTNGKSVCRLHLSGRPIRTMLFLHSINQVFFAKGFYPMANRR
jgi:hypothetical protein